MRHLITAKKVEVAALWAIVPTFFGLWGMGYLYAGRKVKGLIWLVLGLVLLGWYFLGVVAPDEYGERLIDDPVPYGFGPGLLIVFYFLFFWPLSWCWDAREWGFGSEDLLLRALAMVMVVIPIWGIASLWQCYGAVGAVREHNNALTETEVDKGIVAEYEGAKKNEVAILLFALLPGFLGILGIGHFFVRRALRGISFLILGIALSLFGMSLLSGDTDDPTWSLYSRLSLVLVALFVFSWIWQAWDAWRWARKYNRALELPVPTLE